MALADLLNEYVANKSEWCAFQTLVNSLPKSDQIALQNALDKGIPASVIINALKSDGHKTSNDSFYKHQKGICKCPKG
jgi:hypothetical protein